MKTDRMFLAALLLAAVFQSVAFGADKPLQPPYSHRGSGSGSFPAKDLVTSFYDYSADRPLTISAGNGKEQGIWGMPADIKPGTRSNVVWRTTMPSWGCNDPVAVKDRVFVLTEPSPEHPAPLLVCTDVNTGKILWQQPVDHLDDVATWPKEKADEARKLRQEVLNLRRDRARLWNFVLFDVKTGQMRDTSAKQEIVARLAQARKLRMKDADITDPNELSSANIHERQVAFDRVTDAAEAARRKALVQRVGREQIHLSNGWDYVPFYGVTMGAVVSDGQYVYAVTGIGGAACYDLEGNRRWVVHLKYPRVSNENHNISAPILAGGLLIYFHRDAAMTIALDPATGAVQWATRHVLKTFPSKAGHHPKFGEYQPLGYIAHMDPGGTPVAMALPNKSNPAEKVPVVILGTGMVMRLSDGASLGMVKLPDHPSTVEKARNEAERKFPHDADAQARWVDEATNYGGPYSSWAAHGDMLFAQKHVGSLHGIRLAIDGDHVSQEVLWSRYTAKFGGKERPFGSFATPSVDFHDGMLYHLNYAIDPATGELLTQEVPVSTNYTRSRVYAGRIAVWNVSQLPHHNMGNFHPFKSLGDVFSYVVLSLPDLTIVSRSFLVPPVPTNELRRRHIDLYGKDCWSPGSVGITAFGNRLFARSNDYLWCIGDPNAKWIPPEECLK